MGNDFMKRAVMIDEFGVEKREFQKWISVLSKIVIVIGLIMTVLFFTSTFMSILAFIATALGVIGLIRKSKSCTIIGAVMIILLMALIIYVAVSVPSKHDVSPGTRDESVAMVENEYKTSDQAVSIHYDAKKWSLIEAANDGKENILALKDLEAKSIFGGIRIKQFEDKVTEEEYYKVLELAYEKNAIEGSVKRDRIRIGDRDFTIMHFKTDENGIINCFDTLVIYNGIDQYELILQLPEDRYDEFKDEAYDVLNTVSVLKEPRMTVESNDEMVEAMKSLDRVSGIDKESVKNNIDKSGSELIGIWGFEKSDGSIDIRMILKEDGSCIRYQAYPSEKDLKIGTWRYEDGVLYIRNKKLILNGKEVSLFMRDKNVKLELLSFNGGIMKLRDEKHLIEFSYKKVE